MGFKGVFDAVLKDRRISCEACSIVAAYEGKQRNRLGSLRVLKAARPLSISGASESLRFASHKIDGIRTKYPGIPGVEELNLAPPPPLGGLDFSDYLECNGLHGRIGRVI